MRHGVVDQLEEMSDVERKIQVELLGDDYHLAIFALDQSKMVRVEGDIHVKSKSAQLLNLDISASSRSRITSRPALTIDLIICIG